MRTTRDDDFDKQLMRYHPDLCRYALSLCKQRSEAEDLVQETVRKALEMKSDFQPGTNLRSWLFSLQFNAHRAMIRDAARRRSRETYDPDAFANVSILPPQNDHVLMQDVEHLIQKLPDDKKEALILIVFDGLSYEEAASRLDCSLGTVKSRVNRAKMVLADLAREPLQTSGPSMKF